MINAALKVLAGIAAHAAAATNDTSLKMDSDITACDLKRMRNNDLITEVHEIYDLGMSLAPELKIWTVEQPDIDALDTNSAAFNAKDPAIKNIRVNSAQAIADIKSKMDEVYTFTKETLDPMMLPLKMTNPSKHGEYLKARTIINTAGAHSKSAAPDAPALVK